MSREQLLHGSTGNSIWYLFPWTLPVFYCIAFVGVGMSFLLLTVAHNWLMASLLFNLFLVSVVGMMAREQLTYAFVACLPNYQPAVRRHLLLIGIAGNVLLLVVGLVFYQVPLQDKLDTALALFCGGIALYCVLCRVILSIENLGYWNLIFSVVLITPTMVGMDLSASIPFVVPLGFLLRLLLLLLAGFSVWWLWQLLAQPQYFRRVMDLPVSGGFDSFNSREGWLTTYDLMQKARERRREASRLEHWVATVGIPGHSCVRDQLNVVVNRTLTSLVSPAFWLMTVILCVFQAWSWGRGGPRFAPVAMLYPMLLLLFTLKSTDVSSVSPLLPYSRLARACGVVAANLLSLVLFFAFMWVTWRGSLLLGAFLNQGGVVRVGFEPRDIALAILLWAPAYLMGQLWLSVMRAGALIAMMLFGMACLAATVTTIGALSKSHQQGTEVHLLWWFVIGWSLYLLLLYLRFSRGSLDQR